MGDVVRAGAVNFHSNLDPVALGVFANFVERRADLLHRLFHRHVFRQAVRTNLDAAAADVVAKSDESLALLDILFDDGWIGTLKFADGAQSDQLHLAIAKPFGHFGALAVVERGLDPVLVRGAQFDPFETGVLAILDQRRQVPFGAPEVSDQSELHAETPMRWAEMEADRPWYLNKPGR